MDKNPEFESSEGEESSRDTAAVKPQDQNKDQNLEQDQDKDLGQDQEQEQDQDQDQEPEEEDENGAVGENGVHRDGDAADARPIKTEAEDPEGDEPGGSDPEGREDHQRYLQEDQDQDHDQDVLLKEEAGSEDGFDEDEDRDVEGDDEAPAEPQDLSTAEYNRYDHDAAVAAAGEDQVQDQDQDQNQDQDQVQGPGGAGRVPAAGGKLSCDICGLSCISINVLLVHKRSHTGERPFHCSQCGASFTQKGNLLRHIKLHSGEKPFKCPMCSYACRRRDALSGHLRTHSVEKPFKCNNCSRSYKQRSSLEEHRERCHVFAPSRAPAEREDVHAARPPVGPERALLLDRLASNVAKRKSTMPQKFTGDSDVCLDLSFNRDLVPRSDGKDLLGGSSGPDAHQHHPPVLPRQDLDPPPAKRPYSVPLNRADVGGMSLTNGHKLGLPLLGLPPGVDPFLADGPHGPHGPQGPLAFSLGHLLGNGGPHPHAPPLALSPVDALRVLRADGDGGAPPGAVYPCGHCRVVFLDYVMFTIHMGCHGFRDPLECNVCGHRSRDRYEFSSHIARGEHRLDLK